MSLEEESRRNGYDIGEIEMMTTTMNGGQVQRFVHLQLHSPACLLPQSPPVFVFHLNRQLRHFSPPVSAQHSSRRVAFIQSDRRKSIGASSLGKEETELSISTDPVQAPDEITNSKDLEYVRQIQRVAPPHPSPPPPPSLSPWPFLVTRVR